MSVQRAVLDSALEIIAISGPEEVSMREVARRAGVSHQAPYHHFSDRSGIFAAIAEEGFNTLTDAFRKVLNDDTHPALRCFGVYIEVALQNPGHFRVMFRADLNGVATHPTAKAAAERAFDELLNMVHRTIGRPTSTKESFTWASLLWSTAHGFATLLIDGPLAQKLPPGMNTKRLINDVVALMTEMVERQAAAMGLAPGA